MRALQGTSLAPWLRIQMGAIRLKLQWGKEKVQRSCSLNSAFLFMSSHRCFTKRRDSPLRCWLYSGVATGALQRRWLHSCTLLMDESLRMQAIGLTVCMTRKWQSDSFPWIFRDCGDQTVVRLTGHCESLCIKKMQQDKLQAI